jgi:hypothetical protein
MGPSHGSRKPSLQRCESGKEGAASTACADPVAVNSTAAATTLTRGAPNPICVRTQVNICRVTLAGNQLITQRGSLCWQQHQERLSLLWRRDTRRLNSRECSYALWEGGWLLAYRSYRRGYQGEESTDKGTTVDSSAGPYRGYAPDFA